MKKIILTFVLLAGASFVMNAQTGSTNADGSTSKDKQKTAVEQSGASTTAKTQTTEATTTDSTTKSATAEKKCAKKSCCKKTASDSDHKCDKDHADGAACCKKKAEATETKKE